MLNVYGEGLVKASLILYRIR